MDKEGSMNEKEPLRDELTLKQLIVVLNKNVKYILSKWYIILLAGMLGGALGYLYAYRKQPLYTATTTFVLESGEQGGGLGQISGLAALAGVDISGGSNNLFQGDNLFALYKSRTMVVQALLSPNPLDTAELLINQYIQMTNPDEMNKKGERPSLVDFKKDPKSLDNFSRRERDSLLGIYTDQIVKNNLKVDKLDKKSTIIAVEINSNSEQFSKSFNEVLVKTVNDFYVKTKTKKSLDNIAILQNKTDSVRAVLNGSISSVAAAVDLTPNLNPTRQAQRTVPMQRSQISAETSKAILAQLMQNLELSKMNLMKESPLIEKIDEPIYPLDRRVSSKAKMAILGFVLTSILTAIGLLLNLFICAMLKVE